MNYNCKFCGRQTQETGRFQHHSDFILEFYCDYCFTSFQYNTTTKEIERWKIVVHNYRVYHMVVNLREKALTISYYVPSKDDYELIFHGTVIPDSLTPSNALRKLKTYILFS